MDYCIWVAWSGYLRSWSNPSDNFKVHNSYRLATDKARQLVGIEGRTRGQQSPKFVKVVFWRDLGWGACQMILIQMFWIHMNKVGRKSGRICITSCSNGQSGIPLRLLCVRRRPRCRERILWKRQIWISHDRPTFSHYNHHLLGTFFVYSISFCIFLQFFRVKMPQVPRRDNQAQRLQDKEAKRARGLSSQWFL